MTHLTKSPIKKQVAIALSILDAAEIPVKLREILKQNIKGGFWQVYKDYLLLLNLNEESENGEKIY